MCKEQLMRLIDGAKTPAQVRQRLRNGNIEYEDATAEFGRFNARIPLKGGCFRIYQDYRNAIRSQWWPNKEFKASGIPTFFE